MKQTEHNLHIQKLTAYLGMTTAFSISPNILSCCSRLEKDKFIRMTYIENALLKAAVEKIIFEGNACRIVG